MRESDKNKRFKELISTVLTENNEPPADLLSRIMAAIKRRQRIYAGIEIAGFSLSFTISLAALFFGIGELGRQLAQAGTLKIFSLIISDFAVVLANWQEFMFSFLESFPLWPMILTLAGVLLLLISVKFIFDKFPKVNLQPIFKNNFNY